MTELKKLCSLLCGIDKHMKDFSVLRSAQSQVMKGEWLR